MLFLILIFLCARSLSSVHLQFLCARSLSNALPNQQTVDYPSFKLVIVGDGGTAIMADAVVTFLLENLSGRLQEEANFLAGVEDKVNLFIGELRFINIFLKNSQGKRIDEIVKEVVRQIRDVAHEAEDVIDSFISKVAEHRRMSTMKRMVDFPYHRRMLRDVGKKIVGIKEKINEIYNNRERYGIESVEASVNAVEEEEAMHRRRREVEEDDVVGFVHDSTKLVKQLTEEGNRELDVISIIGMGGLGKTTLAKKIYNKLCVTGLFKCHVWVCVSQNFKIRDLLLTILKELGKKLEDMSESEEDELKKQLLRCLQGRRFLVVMDDIWRPEVWDAVRFAFPDDSNRSRILITSRNKEVALGASHTPPYYLPFLNKNESWELFSKKVFRGRTCPPELEILGRQIAEGCQGLPLSIVVLAGRLAKMDKSLHIWSKFVGDHVTSFLNRNEDTTICKKILSLSYTDLPDHLKPCFLYFGMYPEDFQISVRQLINLWVAEGFIQQTRHRWLEDDAEMYLEELIDRSLIQVASRRTDGGVKTCRIHDLLRDLCITESAKEKFLEVHSDYDSSTNNSRRLSIQGKFGRYMSSNPSFPTHARSLLLFGHTEPYLGNRWTWLEENFKLLRVLDYAPHFSVFPKSMATFIHLKYLRFDIVDTIPDYIFNLTNLVTLRVQASGYSRRYLSKGIFKLHRLRNLYLPCGWSLPWDSEGALLNLQVLSILEINYDPQQHSFLFVPKKFPNVRTLKIHFNRESLTDRHEVVSIPSLHHLARLETLRIWSCGMFAGNPNSIPSTVTNLNLRAVESVETCVTELGKLRNLRVLKLHVHEDRLFGARIHVTAYSFPQLHFLQLHGLKIEEWNQERSVMPRLTHLVILRCEFRRAPELLSLTTLQYVKMKDSPDLARMLRFLPREFGFELVD